MTKITGKFDIAHFFRRIQQKFRRKCHFNLTLRHFCGIINLDDDENERKFDTAHFLWYN